MIMLKYMLYWRYMNWRRRLTLEYKFQLAACTNFVMNVPTEYRHFT